MLECLASDACEPYSPHDFGYSIMPAIVNKKAVYAYPFMGFWRDIGTVESYYQTNLELIDRLPLLNVGRKWQITTQEVSVPFHNSYDRDRVIHSLIGPHCIVRGTVENSVLSPGVVVGENAVVKNSIIMAGSSIGDYSHLDHCIVDEDVSIGAFCKVGLGTGSNICTFDTTVIVGRGTSVPDYTFVPARAEMVSQARLNGSTADVCQIGCSTAG